MKTHFLALITIAALSLRPVPTYADGKGGKGGKGVNGGVPVPEVQNDEASADFLAARIAGDTGWPAEEMIPYATRLAKTLSQLSAKEQAEVFYGSN